MSLLVVGAVHEKVVNGAFESVRPTVAPRAPLPESLLFVLLFFDIADFVVWIFISAYILDHACKFLDLRAQSRIFFS